jgi:hypothetical protein
MQPTASPFASPDQGRVTAACTPSHSASRSSRPAGPEPPSRAPLRARRDHAATPPHPETEQSNPAPSSRRRPKPRPSRTDPRRAAPKPVSIPLRVIGALLRPFLLPRYFLPPSMVPLIKPWPSFLFSPQRPLPINMAEFLSSPSHSRDPSLTPSSFSPSPPVFTVAAVRGASPELVLTVRIPRWSSVRTTHRRSFVRRQEPLPARAAAPPLAVVSRRRRARTPSKPRRYQPVEPLPLVDVHHSLRRKKKTRLKTTH